MFFGKTRKVLVKIRKHSGAKTRKDFHVKLFADSVFSKIFSTSQKTNLNGDVIFEIKEKDLKKGLILEIYDANFNIVKQYGYYFDENHKVIHTKKLKITIYKI